MTDTHIFNERLKRLEPKDTKCQFCKLQLTTSMNDNYFVPIFKEQDRTNIIVYSSVKFSKILIGIPRCKSCREIHSAAVKRSNIIATITAITIIVLGFLIYGSFGFFGIFIGIFIGFGGSYFLSKKYVRDKQILNPKEGAEQNKTAQDFINTGWTFSQPSA
jgi:cadmium resistance protein CadD (predicted permease)